MVYSSSVTHKSSPTIRDLGFKDYAKAANIDLSEHPEASIARVIEEHRTRWVLASSSGQLDASVRGAMHYDLDTEAFPKVGDWVTYAPSSEGKATIETILPRISMITRKNISGVGNQVIVTNVDAVAIVQGADQDFNIPRLERYLELAQKSGAAPLFIFTKSDKSDVSKFAEEAARIAPEIPRIKLSVRTGEGMQQLATYLAPGKTLVLLGSSGAGKSTLLNALIQQDIQLTQAIRKEDGKGRHTTTRRSLFMLPGGALVIDTPGMRELSSAEDDESKKDMFEDVVEISYRCKYPNCDHKASKGCAILEALATSTLSQERYEAFMKFLTQQEKLTVKKEGNKHSDRVKSNRATLNYESRRQSEEE